MARGLDLGSARPLPELEGSMYWISSPRLAQDGLNSKQADGGLETNEGAALENGSRV